MVPEVTKDLLLGLLQVGGSLDDETNFRELVSDRRADEIGYVEVVPRPNELLDLLGLLRRQLG